MILKNNDFEELEQYDYSHDGEYLEKVFLRYSSVIGVFLLKFSILEHELNIAIADIISSRSHEAGYVIIEKLSINDKIELFYKKYVRLESFKDQKSKKTLCEIKEKLKTINSFRNNIVHANWISLEKDGMVRTKIAVDNQEGCVKFKKVKIIPKIIRQKIKEIDKLTGHIYEYKETALQY